MEVDNLLDAAVANIPFINIQKFNFMHHNIKIFLSENKSKIS